MAKYSSQVKTVQTIGLDVGDRQSVYVVLDGEGQVIEEGRVATRQRALEEQFSQWPGSRVVLEVCGQSAWMSRLLSGLGHEVLVARARNLKKLWGEACSTDRVEAECLARMGRVEPKLLKPIRHRAQETQEDLVLLRGREQLVRARTRLVNAVRGQMKQFGRPLARVSTAAFARRVGAQIPGELKAGLGPLVAVIAHLSEQIRELDGKIERLGQEKYPQTQLLRQIPGVGAVTALAFVLVVESPQHFARNRQVGAYLGLTPGKDQSGDQDPELGISKAGNGMLRRLLVQSAHYVLGPFGADSDLKRWGEQLVGRGGQNAKKRAVVAVARKLGVLLLLLWRNGEEYQPLYHAQRKVAA